MTVQLKVTVPPAALDFLVKAYLLNPDIKSNQSSIAVFGGNYNEHNSAPIPEIIDQLKQAGYIKLYETRLWREEHGGGEVAIFRVYPLGRQKAEQLLQAKVSKSLKEKVSSIPRSDWIALAALAISILALFVSGS